MVPCAGTPSVLEAEAFGLFHATSWCDSMQLENVVFQVDCKTVVDAILAVYCQHGVWCYYIMLPFTSIFGAKFFDLLFKETSYCRSFACKGGAFPALSCGFFFCSEFYC